MARMLAGDHAPLNGLGPEKPKNSGDLGKGPDVIFLSRAGGVGGALAVAGHGWQCGGFEVSIIIAARLCRNFKSKNRTRIIYC